MMKKTAFSFLAISLLFIILSCGGGSGGYKAKNSQVNINALFSESASSSNIVTIRYSVTGPGMEPMTGMIPVTSSVVEFDLDVPNGPDRYFLIEALNVSGSVLYEDSATRDLDGTPVIIDIVLAPSVFTLNDFQGTWNVHSIFSGDSPQWTGWTYGQETADASGNFTSTSFLNSDGDTDLPSNEPLAITPDGIITIVGEPTTHGAMSTGKDLIVGTSPEYEGGYELVVLQKAGGSFTTNDLQGTWNFHGVSSGDAPQWTGWEYGQFNVDASGNYTWTSSLDSDGDTDLPSNEPLAITPDGIITIVGEPTTHGAMSTGKDLIVGTNTDGEGGYELVVLQKAGGSFTTNDLQGTWNFHGVSSGDAPQWTGWFYGQTTTDTSGNSFVLSFLDSDGNTTPQNYNVTNAITSDGIVTDSSNPSYHGVMNLDKNLVVATETNEGEGYTLYVIQKVNDSFTPPPPPVTIVGNWETHFRCAGISTDVAVLEIELNETTGGDFSGSGTGTDIDGKQINMTLVGNFNSSTNLLSATLTSTFEMSTCVREDVFSTTLSSNDTGYILMNQTQVCGCDGEVRLIKLAL